MAYFPLFVDLNGKKCLIVGGGKVAYRKARAMADYGVKVTVIAARACGEMKEFGEEEGTLLLRKAVPQDAEGADLVICNSCRVLPDGTKQPHPAEQTFAADTLLDEEAFWDAFNTPWISQFTGTAHRLYAARLFEGVRYPVGMVHEDYYILPDLIARCGKVQCLAYTGYYVLQHEGSITATARHEVRLAMTRGDIHRAEYFLSRRWYDRAEGALTDAADFLYRNKAAYDLRKPGHRAEFAAVKAELCRVYGALATQKGSKSLGLRAAALRLGLPVFHAYTALLAARR